MRLHEDVMRVLTVKVDAHDEGPSVHRCKNATSVTAASVARREDRR